MNNIFQIGERVKGKSYIGRKEITKYFRKMYLESDLRVNKAIVGMTHVGKSSLVDNVFQDIPNNTLYIYENLSEWSTYDELWQDICLDIEDKINKLDIEKESLSEYLATIQEKQLPWIKLNRTVKKIFEELAIRQIKTILVLDEFDNATNIFSEGTKHFELFRSIFSDGKFNVSALTVSRRNLHMIEGTTYQSSTFHGVLDEIPLKGFNDDDMKEYYNVFEEQNIKLTDEQKKDIEYYAGRSPLLLTILGHYIVDSAENGAEIDILEIFSNRCKAINDHYRDCIGHLKRDDDLKRIIPFVIGPNVGVTQLDKDELINLGYLREEKDGLTAISGFFPEFLSNNVLQVNIWDNIINLEKKMKQIVECEFIKIIDHYKIGGNTITETQRNLLNKVKGISESDIIRYDKFISNNKKVFEKQSTFLDVMSLTDVFKIIKECWQDIFSQYFDLELYSEWGYKFDKCSRARNPIAHGHEEYLSELEKNEVDTYCKQIFEKIAGIAINNVSGLNEMDVIKTTDKYRTENINNQSTKEEHADDLLVGKIVEFEVKRRGGAQNNNLAGTVNGKYNGTIPKNYLTEVNLEELIGKKLQLRVEKIIDGRYIIEYKPQ